MGDKYVPDGFDEQQFQKRRLKGLLGRRGDGFTKAQNRKLVETKDHLCKHQPSYFDEAVQAQPL